MVLFLVSAHLLRQFFFAHSLVLNWKRKGYAEVKVEEIQEQRFQIQVKEVEIRDEEEAMPKTTGMLSQHLRVVGPTQSRAEWQYWNGATNPWSRSPSALP
jgi:hypothetical protein